jgi:predicted site-specific integrase-resolvase
MVSIKNAKKHPGNGIGHLTPDGYFTVAEVAERCGRSVDTIKRWNKTGLFKPSHVMRVGKLSVWLYSEQDIAEMKEIAVKQRPGRKPKPVVVKRRAA